MGHTAKTLFDLNIKSSGSCLTLHRGITGLNSTLDSSWLLRGSVVFSISSMDAYFHDKLKYRAGKFNLDNMPEKMRGHTIRIEDLETWEYAERKGNVLRN